MNLRVLFFLLAAVAAAASQAQVTNTPPPAEQAPAEPQERLIIEAPGAQGELDFNFATGLIVYSNGVIVKYGPAVLTADRVEINQQTLQTWARGNVVLVSEGGHLWRGSELSYNFKTRVMSGRDFRAGSPPYFVAATNVITDPTNGAYTVTNAMFTTDDRQEPNFRIRAKKIVIIPGQSIEARHAVLYAGSVPIFYFPYFHKTLDKTANHFETTPGFRSEWGPFLLNSYNWYWDKQLSGAVNFDFRGKRGFGGGPDVFYKSKTFGEAMARYYIVDDWDPEKRKGYEEPGRLRDHALMTYQGTLRTNLSVRGMVSYERDASVRRDFFESEYHRDVQPKTFIEVEQQWRNWTLDAMTRARINDFEEGVDRMPDIKLSGYRQQIGSTPLYYEGESSVGYYRHLFPEMQTNQFYPVHTNDYAAGRADSLHQLLLPQTYFGFLNVTPRIGYRATWYSEAEGGGTVTEEETRNLFATGTEITWKASRVFRDAENSLLDVNGIRHIIEPSLNYAYIPDPDVDPQEVPLFDRRLPSARLLPIDFPQLQTIDSIDDIHTVRLGVRNRLQTKREEGMDDLVDFGIFSDLHVERNDEYGTKEKQDRFSDIYTDLRFKPRSWLLFESETRYDIKKSGFFEAMNQVTVQPGNIWSVQLGHLYRDRSRELGTGNDLLRTSFYYRLNENWGFRTAHYFEGRTGVLEYQYYTVYRDMRSWTGALTLRMRQNDDGSSDDFTVAIAISPKAMPRYGVGDDALNPNRLIGR